jgi:putative beta-lysine N-acetyltransferase
MYDKIEKIGKSTIQHGKYNNRIYIMKLDKSDYPQIINKLDLLAAKFHYTKICGKIPAWASDNFQSDGYLKEAFIPNFYDGKVEVLFFSKFIDHYRSILDLHERELIDKYIEIALNKKKKPITIKHNDALALKILTKEDVSKLKLLYEKVFKSYPFPIFEENYLKNTMYENVIYFGVFLKDKLIAASSAEMDLRSKNAEMTDFATDPGYTGNNLSLILLREMEAEMRRRKIKMLYTIARSKSAGMNITFGKMDYEYAGTLINNTNISGKIESMNIWYKSNHK